MNQPAASLGEENTRLLAVAYDTAVSVLALGDMSYTPARDIRRAMIQAMLDDARVNGFNQGRLTLAALAAAKTR